MIAYLSSHLCRSKNRAGIVLSCEYGNHPEEEIIITYNIIRGVGQIGGNIIGIAESDTRILLDCGALLPEVGAEPQPDPFDINTLGMPDAVFLSHHHGDHTGLIDRLPKDIPVYASMGTIAVLNAVGDFVGKPGRPLTPFHAGSPVKIGALTVTPIPVEHSAHDSMMLLVEGSGQRLLYTGDYKSVPKALESHLDQPIDVLITEGTMLTRGVQAYPDEAAVQRSLEDVLRGTQGRVFVLQSTANIARIRSVLAARDAVCPVRPIMQDIFMKYLLNAIGEEELVNKYAYLSFHMDEHRTAPGAMSYFKELNEKCEVTGYKPFYELPDAIVFIRPSMLPMLQKLRSSGICFQNSALIFSMWKGYINDPKCAALLSFFADEGVEPQFIHSSGHAEADKIKRLVELVHGKDTILVHSEIDRWNQIET